MDDILLKKNMLIADINIFLITDSDIDIDQTMSELLSFIEDNKPLIIYSMIQKLIVGSNISLNDIKPKLNKVLSFVFKENECDFIVDLLSVLYRLEDDVDVRLNKLFALDISIMKDFVNIQIDYYKALLDMLLNQLPINIDKIREINEKLKELVK